jgi:hypothetical protein
VASELILDFHSTSALVVYAMQEMENNGASESNMDLGSVYRMVWSENKLRKM